MTYRFQRKISSRTAEITTPSGSSIRLPYTGDVPQPNTIVHPTFNKCCCPIELSFDKNQKPQFNDVSPRRTRKKRKGSPKMGNTMFLLDTSFAYLIVAELIVKNLKNHYREFKYSTIATFNDKPIPYFGTKEGWVYKVAIPKELTEEQYISALDNFSYVPGGFNPRTTKNCQFETLLNAVITLGRQYKYVLVLTDSDTHLPGDYSLDYGQPPDLNLGPNDPPPLYYPDPRIKLLPHDHKTIVGPQYDGSQLDYPKPRIVLNMAKRVNMIPIFTHISYLPYVEEAKWGYVIELPNTMIYPTGEGLPRVKGFDIQDIIKAGTTQYNPQGYGMYKK